MRLLGLLEAKTLKDFPTIRDGDVVSLDGDKFKVDITGPETAIITPVNSPDNGEEVLFKKEGEKIIVLDPFSIRQLKQSGDAMQYVKDFKIIKSSYKEPTKASPTKTILRKRG